jgi:hypothetical protein
VRARSANDDDLDEVWRAGVDRACEERDDTPPEDSAPPDARSDAEWLAEIERRARAALAGSPGIPWEKVRSELEQRFGRP